MMAVIIIMVVFDAQAAGRAAARAIIGPDRAKARVIAGTCSLDAAQGATPSLNQNLVRRATVTFRGSP